MIFRSATYRNANCISGNSNCFIVVLFDENVTGGTTTDVHTESVFFLLFILFFSRFYYYYYYYLCTAADAADLRGFTFTAYWRTPENPTHRNATVASAGRVSHFVDDKVNHNTRPITLNSTYTHTHCMSFVKRVP